MKAPDIEKLISSPEQSAQAMVEWAKRCRDTPGIRFGIPAMDEYVLPIRVPDLVGIIARPGAGKTSLMALLAERQALAIDNDRDIVIFATWEQAKEELEVFFHVRSTGIRLEDIAHGVADIETLERSAAGREKLPLWLVGHSLSYTDDDDVSAATANGILETIRFLRGKHGKNPALLILDYLQVIPVPGARGKKEAVPQLPVQLRRLSLRAKVPIIVGVQARRDTDRRETKLPNMDDAEWSSSVDQTFDKLFGLWMPHRTEGPGSTVTLNGAEYPVTRELIFIKLLKQRGGPAGRIWAMHFQPELMRLAELEMRPIEGGYQ